MQDFTLKDWDDYAVCYDALQELKPYTAMLKNVIKLCKFNQGDFVLDIGCGTGNFAMFGKRQIAKNDVSYFGIDTSSAMLSVARAKNLGSNFHFQQQDSSEYLSRNKIKFSTIVSINSLYAHVNPQKTLRQIYSNLKTGGFLILVTPKESYENGLILKKHLGDMGADKDWLNVHESEEKENALIERAICNPRLRKKVKKLAIYNRAIARNHEFFFYKEEDFLKLLHEASFEICLFSNTYAEQDFLCICKK